MWIVEQAAILYLYNINWLVFITETECVYCAVRAGSLNVPHVIVSVSHFSLVFLLLSSTFLLLLTLLLGFLMLTDVFVFH